MRGSRSYFTLIGSLPALPPDYKQADRVPISRHALTDRLKMLSPRDAQVVERMSDFLVWDRQPLERTDEEVMEHYDLFMRTIRDRFVRTLIEQVMSFRTIITALRCRRLNAELPRGGPAITTLIARNWHQPDFHLGGQFPWIIEMDTKLNSDSPFDLEQMQLDIIWKYAKRRADHFHFSFEAVVLYLIRWEVVNRWVTRDAEVGQETFNQLVLEAMGPYANLYAESEGELASSASRRP